MTTAALPGITGVVWTYRCGGDASAGTVDVPPDGLLVGGAFMAGLLSPVGFALALRYLDVEERPDEE